MKALLPLLAASLLAGCGQQAGAAQSPVTYRAHGLTVELPDGWQHADGSLTRLEDPREVLSVGTYPLHYRQAGCAQLPTGALEDLGPGDALVTVLERGFDAHSTWSDFPPRPVHFGPLPHDASEAHACAPGGHFSDHWLRFTDAGRHFHVLVAFGPEATKATREEAWSLLDGLQVDPVPRPDWQSSG